MGIQGIQMYMAEWIGTKWHLRLQRDAIACPMGDMVIQHKIERYHCEKQLHFNLFPMNMYSTGLLYPLVGKSEMLFLSKWQKQWANTLSVVQKMPCFLNDLHLKNPHIYNELG